MATNGYKIYQRSLTSPQQGPYSLITDNRHPRTAPMASRPLDSPSPSKSCSEDLGALGGSGYHSFPSTEHPQERYSLDQDSERFKSFPLSKGEEISRTRQSSRPSPQFSHRKQPHSLLHSDPAHHLPKERGHLGPEEGKTTGSSPYMSYQSDAGPSSLRRHSPITASKLPDDSEPSIPRYPGGDVCSQDTVENARYSLDKPPSSDHPNEDRHFAVEGDKFKVLCVFDGHDGSRAAGFASNYLLKLLHQRFWMNIVDKADSSVICEALQVLFLDTEEKFFGSIENFIQQKKRLQEKIPQHLTSYEAYLQYPNEVEQLQEIEPKLTGGCTAVMAVVIDNVLYVANVGDARAVLVREDSKGVLVTEQLTTDHTVENEDELKRLEALGLSPRDLIKAGRLGPQENTRSIGDYSIKSGYKDVDSIRSASSPPGIARPSVATPRKLDRSCKYLILMTDGVYKSIESTFPDPQAVESNKVVFHMIQHGLGNVHRFEDLSSNVLERIASVNKDAYMTNARKDVRSQLAVACRKRDDMTLIVHKLSSND